jgi:hypothetical protein
MPAVAQSIGVGADATPPPVVTSPGKPTPLPVGLAVGEFKLAVGESKLGAWAPGQKRTVKMDVDEATLARWQAGAEQLAAAATPMPDTAPFPSGQSPQRSGELSDRTELSPGPPGAAAPAHIPLAPQPSTRSAGGERQRRVALGAIAGVMLGALVVVGRHTLMGGAAVPEETGAIEPISAPPADHAASSAVEPTPVAPMAPAIASASATSAPAAKSGAPPRPPPAAPRPVVTVPNPHPGPHPGPHPAQPILIE